MTLRLRLTAVVAAVVAGAVVVVAGAAFYLAFTETRGETDRLLLERARAFSADPSLRDSSGELPDDVPSDVVEFDVVVQVLGADGTIEDELEGQPELPVTDQDRAIAADGGQPQLRTVTVEGERYRMVTASISDGGAVQVARSSAETEDVLDVLRNRLLVVALAGTGSAGVVAWLVVRRATRPIERLTRAAERVTATQDLTVPLAVRGSGRDEVGRLAASFNAMLGALAASKEQQKRLVLDASHELGTPLTAVRTNIDFLERADRLDGAQQRQILAETRLELAELTDMVDELVEMATDVRSDEPLVEVDLGQLATEVADRFHRRSGRVVDASVEHAATIAGRRSMLERAVANLVDNALKFSPSDTAVDLVVDGTLISVRDRGSGLGSVDRDRVFDRFYRAEATRSTPGSGLGLAIVQQIVDIHGGTVRLDDREGGGAVATILLPPP